MQTRARRDSAESPYAMGNERQPPCAGSIHTRPRSKVGASQHPEKDVLHLPMRRFTMGLDHFGQLGLRSKFRLDRIGMSHRTR